MTDLKGLGTPEQVWVDSGRLDSLDALDWDGFLPLGGKVVLVVPHPDDEVLGLAGVLQELARRATPVLLVAVTDGEASHPGRAAELRPLRASERALALSVLGSDPEIVRLGHPDGAVDEQRLRGQLRELVGPHDVALAPWSHDGHPDHDACGRATAGLGLRTYSYLVWAWHWATPADLPWEKALRVPLSVTDLTHKRRAVAAFRSQLAGADPILPAHVTDRLLRAVEVLLVG